MIQIVLYQNTNQRIAEAYGKWFPRVANTETVALEELSFVFFLCAPGLCPKRLQAGSLFLSDGPPQPFLRLPDHEG